MFDSIKKLIKKHFIGPRIGDIYQEYYYAQNNVSPWQRYRNLIGLVKVLDLKDGWIRFQSVSDEEIYERKVSSFLNNYAFYSEGEVENV